MFRVRTTFTGIQGSPWLSTFHFADDGAPGSAQAAVTDTGTFWTAVDAHMGGTVQWATEAEVEQIDIVTGDLEGVVVTTPATGSGTASEVGPIAMQGLVRWRTGTFVSSRELRGRTFIPALTESANASGSVSTTVTSAVNTAAATLLGSANSGLMVWSRTHGVANLATSGTMWTQFAYLGSRRD